tara:strand:- start:181 stop:612 length:432 start_codon:yes stop_codon:yes gene_type:complete
MVIRRDQVQIFDMSRSQSQITERQQRLLDELKKVDDELSGQELHRQLLQSENTMGLATVYRNLQVLVRQGLVRSRHLATGEVLYTPVDRDIHHLTCVNCGETTRLEGCPIHTSNVPAKIAKNFELLFHTLEFFGLCQECSSKK